MNYAIIDDGIVVNIIYIHPNNVHEFESAVPVNDYFARIGDTYSDGKFYRDGVEVLTMTTIEKESNFMRGYDKAIQDLIEQGVL